MTYTSGKSFFGIRDQMGFLVMRDLYHTEKLAYRPQVEEFCPELYVGAWANFCGMKLKMQMQDGQVELVGAWVNLPSVEQG